MGSLSSPKTWPPNMNTKDCTQGFCSVYCPQWCYLIFPPPPPMDSSSSSSSSSTSSFSPLVIAIIGVLASAFLLVSYYAVISKFCRVSGDRSRDSWPHTDDMVNNNDNDNDNVEHEPWNARAAGLDEALIKLISVHKYTKGDKAFPSTDCSVCLGEFEEGEALRLLPKCSHAFHIACIDKWLKSHSSCPLCRSNIVSMFTLETIQSGRPIDHSLLMPQHERIDLEGGEGDGHEEVVQVLPAEIVEIRDEAERRRSTRRSLSMDYSRERRILIEDEDCQVEECQLHGSAAEHTKDSSLGEAYRVLQCVMRSAVMKRSFSSGRFSFPRNARGRNSVIPV